MSPSDWFASLPAIIDAAKTREGIIALVILSVTMVVLLRRPDRRSVVLVGLMLAAVVVLCSVLIDRRPMAVVAGRIGLDANRRVSVAPQIGQYSADLQAGTDSLFVVVFQQPMPCIPEVRLIASGQSALTQPAPRPEGGVSFSFDPRNATNNGAPTPPVDVLFVAACR